MLFAKLDSRHSLSRILSDNTLWLEMMGINTLHSQNALPIHAYKPFAAVLLKIKQLSFCIL